MEEPCELLELEELLSSSSVSVYCEGDVDGDVSTSGFGVNGRVGGVVGLMSLSDSPLVVGGHCAGGDGGGGGGSLPF